MTAAEKRRHVVLALVGVAGLVLKPLYHGPFADAVHAYGGNFAVSFALYFVAAIAVARVGLGRAAAAASTLAAVEAFELTDGFGVMTNVYDPGDLVANAVGVGCAVAVDLALSRVPRSAGS